MTTATTLEHQALTERAVKNVHDIVTIALERKPSERMLVIFDTEYELTNIITNAYRTAFPDAEFIDFATQTKDALIARCATLAKNDLVALIQSTNFRLDEFRIRLHLFELGLKVIEHLHLSRNTPDSWGTYIDALAYDPAWYRVVGPQLRNVLTEASTLRIEYGDAMLTVTGGLEMPKLNIGDYAGMENIGGTFPIGEVFTEARDLTQMNGSLYVYAYAGADFHINMHTPFRVTIENGIVTDWQSDAPASFADVVHLVRSYERSLIREIGFGLNRAITKEHYLKDITAFERILGLHVSMGEKHSVYKKQGITTHKTKFHVDLFPAVDRVYADDVLIFADGAYTV